MIGSRHKSNVELVGQGIANIASSLFGGIPATGAIARTATNVKNGGRTPVAGMTHAVVVFLVLVFLGKWARFIPLATLAAVLTVVAYHMSEWRAFATLFKTPKSDVAVLLTTFFLTVVIDLTVAVQVGVVLAAFLVIKRMADATNVGAITQDLGDAPDGTMARDTEGVARRTIPEGVEVYEINGPFFFGAAEKFKATLDQVSRRPRILIVRMRNVPAIDSTAMHALKELVRRTRLQGTQVLLSDVHSQPLVALQRADLLAEIGEDNLFGDVDAALEAARTRLGTA
jgi:SulP family sulfate permease